MDLMPGAYFLKAMPGAYFLKAMHPACAQNKTLISNTASGMHI